MKMAISMTVDPERRGCGKLSEIWHLDLRPNTAAEGGAKDAISISQGTAVTVPRWSSMKSPFDSGGTPYAEEWLYVFLTGHW